MATATPRWANSSAVARPRPVAPPVTTTTRPWIVSARRCCSGRGSVWGATTRVASRAAVSQGDVGVKLSNLCSKLNRSEEHTSELQSRQYLVCRLLLEKKKKKKIMRRPFTRRARLREAPRGLYLTGEVHLQESDAMKTPLRTRRTRDHIIVASSVNHEA